MILPEKLVLASASLRAYSPKTWDQFLEGIQEQVDKAATALLSAPPEALQVAQGQARSLTILLAGLKTAHADAEKLKASAKR